MTGKVKCTCGWSWNKSDSSKKDMYICHECGRDNSNNMKNGGWLDSYANGGSMQEHQENYNDNYVSLPEGFVGEGYNTKGRNYSPAWGGQFQMGGSVYPVNYVPEAQMGASIPGAVGFSYARTQSPAPSNGKYAKKTMASAQDGKKVYPEFKKIVPKSEEERLRESLKERPRTVVRDNTAVVNRVEKGKQKTVNPNQQVSTKYNAEKQRKEIVAERKAKIKDSILAQDEDVIGNPNWREVLARETQATGDKFRLFPEEDSFIDNYLNPAVMVGDMASNLGQSPLQAQQQDSYIPYVTSIGTPLAVGALAGIGANSNTQFVNNLINPLAGTKDILKTGVNYIEKKGVPLRMPNHIKNDPNLYVNGISFENNLKRGENSFKLINDDSKEWIGDLDLTKNYWDDAAENQWTIDNVGIEKPYRGKGFGKEAYIKANELLNSTNRGSLYSSGNFEGPDAKRLWRSLVKSGNAEEIGKNSWKFKDKIEIPNQSFQSEINWSKWNKEIPSNTQLMNEYNAIEQATKANGSWMKNPNGSAFQGTPEQFVQQNSNNFKKAFGNSKLINPDGSPEINYHSTYNDFDTFDLNYFDTNTGDGGFFGRGFYTSPNKDLAEGFGEKTMEGYLNIENPIPTKYDHFFGREGLGSNQEFGRFDIKEKFGEYDGVIESHSLDPIAERVFTNPSSFKSATGNNGMFDMTNPNIYKAMLPIGLGLGAASQLDQKREGGVIKDDMGQWAHPGEITEIGSPYITMQGVPYDVLGISDTGDTKLMKPGKNYKFKGKKVTEYPMAKNGLRQEQKGLQNLDNLLNFTNYNTKQPGGWLEAYK